MNYASIIEKATAAVSRPPLKTRRITVTDPFGGRGHDFNIFDDHVNTSGGLAVILSHIPPSERDWIQWKGRTARGDRNGQYSVILCKEDGPIKSNNNVLAEFRTGDERSNLYQERILDALLEICDKETGRKIDGKSEDLQAGQRMNELCDHYYAKYKRDSSAPWPSQIHDTSFSKFLDKYDRSKSAIEAFKSSVGLSYTSVYK